MRICPESGLSRRVAHRATVDFPDPDSPTSANVCPRGISKSTSRAAATGTRFCHRPPRTYCLQSPLTLSKLWIRAPAVGEEIGKLLPILETVHGPRGFGHELAPLAALTQIPPFGAPPLQTANHGEPGWICEFCLR